jgi:hypothetical protein
MRSHCRSGTTWRSRRLSKRGIDSEYPVGAASVNESCHRLVTFSDAFRAIRLRYVLRRAGATWRIDDVHDARGTSLRSLLR